MPVRMLRYLSDILLSNPSEPIYQYLVYIGRRAFSMPNHLALPDFRYQYRLLDMHTVDCSLLLAQDTPEALVLAILCDFKERPAQDVVNYIVTRLRELSGDNEQRFRNYYEMLENLADNRDLQTQLMEAKNMLTQVDITRFSTYRWGLEAGLKQSRALLEEKEAEWQQEKAALQAAEKQRTHAAIKQLLALNTMSRETIAALFKLNLAELDTIAEDNSTQH